MRVTAVRWLGACIAALLGANASAQAWLPAKGSVNVGFVFNDTFNKQHYTSNGDTVDAGHTRVYVDSLTMSYAPTSRVLLAGTLPFVRARYIGRNPHPGSVVDDGRYHSTITDLRLQLHYQLLEEPFAFAPYVGIVIPLHDYPTLGHATPGRGLNEQLVGFYAAKSLDQWLPRTYVQMRYTYAFVEKRAGVSHDRSNADFEIGFFPDPRWSVRALASWQHTHGGIDVPIPVTSPLFPFHDQLVRERYVQIGAGVAWSVTDRLSTYLLYKQSVSGANGHRINDSFIFGVGYAIGHGPQ
jgi:Putative MetA-pathway of phenol degradation